MSNRLPPELNLSERDLEELGISMSQITGSSGGSASGPTNNIPPMSSSSSLPSLAPSDEDLLLAHNQRFQAAVLKAMDESVGVLESKLRDKAASLMDANQARQDMALGLQRMRVEFGRVQRELEKQQKELQEAVSSRKEALTALAHTQQLLRGAEERASAQEQEAAKLRQQMEAIQRQEKQAKDLCGALEAEDKVNRQLNEALRNEITFKDREIVNLVKTSERQRESLEKAHRELMETRNTVAAANDEIKLYKANAEASEKAAERALKEQMEAKKAVEMAVQAMAERDRALIEIADKQEKVRKALEIEKNSVLLQEKALREISSKHEDVTARLNEESEKRAGAAAIARQTMTDLKEVRAEAETLRATVVRVGAEADAATARANQLATDVETQRARVSQLEVENAAMRRAVLDAEAEVRRQESFLTRDEREMRQRADAEILAAQEAALAAENERNATRLKLLQTESDLRDTKANLSNLERDYRMLRQQFDVTAQDAEALEDQVSRAVHRAHQEQHKAEGAEIRAAKERDALLTASQTEIASLKAKLADEKKKFDALSKVFVTTQQKLLEMQDRETNVHSDAATLQSRLTMAQAVSDRFKRNADEKENKFKEAVKDGDLVRVQLKLREGEVSELRERVRVLEARLEEVQMQAQSRAAEQAMQEHTMRHQLARQQGDKQDWSSLLQMAHKDRLSAEAQAKISREKLLFAEQRLQEAQNTIAELRVELRGLKQAQTVKGKEERSWEAQFSKVFERALAKRIGKVVHGKTGTRENTPNDGVSGPAPTANEAAVNRNTTSTVKAPTSSAGSDTERLRDSAFVRELLSELKTELHKALVSAHEHAAEAARLRQKLNSYALSEEEASVREDAYVGKVRELVLERAALAQRAERMEKRALAAQRIAGGMEKQLQEALWALSITEKRREREQVAAKGGAVAEEVNGKGPRPDDFVIDFSQFRDAQPSDRLLRALDGADGQISSGGNVGDTRGFNGTNHDNNGNNDSAYKASGPLAPLAPTALVEAHMQQQSHPPNAVFGAGAIVSSSSQASLWSHVSQQRIPSLSITNSSSTTSLASNASRGNLRTLTQNTSSAPVLLPEITPRRKTGTQKLSKTPSLTNVDLLKKFINDV